MLWKLVNAKEFISSPYSNSTLGCSASQRKPSLDGKQSMLTLS